MKKIIVTLLAAVMALNLCACSGLLGEAITFTKDDLVFTDGSDEITLEINHSIYIYNGYTFVEDHSDYSYEDFEADYTTAKGLAIGDKVDDYKDLYFKSNSNAVWELCTSDNYTSFSSYTGQSAKDMAGSDNNTWLDVGFYLDGGKWKQLSDVEIRDIWFCEADLDDYDEVVIISVCLNSFDEIDCISCNYFEYDNGFVTYQDWDE